MSEDDVRAQLTTPLTSPAFPRGPYRFTDREYLNITYRTDPDALNALVPAPLKVTDPLVRFEVMRMPDVTGLGAQTALMRALGTAPAASAAEAEERR
jgi:acetoacetate decarboxylase